MLTPPGPAKRLEDTRPTYALLCAGVLSTLVLVSMPVLVGAMAAEFGWGDREVGWLASADMAGSALASLCIIPLIGRLRWRPTACAAIAIVVAGNGFSVLADGFRELLAARALTGAGNGIMLSIAYVGLCRSTNPDRFFGLYTFSQLALQIATLSGFPLLLSAYGLSSLFALLALVAIGCLGLVPLLPKTMPAAPAPASTSPARGAPISAISAISVVALVAQGLYFVAPAAVWGYFERIGNSFALTLPQIGTALGAASFAGIAGALLVVVLGARANRKVAMALGTALSVTSMIALVDGTGYARYLGAAALFNFAWNFTFPYQMGILAVLDRTGAVAILSLIVQLAGLAVGPLLASLLHPENGYGTILIACIGCYVVSLALFRASDRTNG